jgi:hypothetical protein
MPHKIISDLARVLALASKKSRNAGQQRLPPTPRQSRSQISFGTLRQRFPALQAKTLDVSVLFKPLGTPRLTKLLHLGSY